MADVFASVAPAPAAPTDPSTETSGRNYTNAKQTPARRAPANDETLAGATNGIADQVRGINSTLAADRAKIEAMEAKPPILTPPPPKHADTDPFQAFGQPAMWLAMFGSLLTRNHLTSAITSAAGVLKATHDMDAESAKQNYESWKVTSENAIKLAKFEQDAYSHAIQKYRADSQAGTAEMEVLFKAYRNAALQHVFETEGMPGVIKYFEHSGNNAELAGKRQAELNDYLEKQKDHVTAIKAWDAANPRADPVVRNAAVSAIRAGHDPSATKVSQWSLVDTPGGQLRYREGPNGPEYSDLDGTPAQAPETAHKSGTTPKPKAGDEARNERNDIAKIKFREQFGRDYDEATASDDDRANFYRLRHEAISTAKTESAPPKGVKPVTYTDSAGVTFDHYTKPDGTAANFAVDGKPYTPVGEITKVASGENAKVGTRRDRELAERERHNGEIERISNDRNLTTEQQTDARQTETNRHNLAMERLGEDKREDAREAKADALLSPEALKDATNEFRATGKMPAVGMGSAAVRKQVLEERSNQLRAESGTVAEDIARQSDVHSLQQALTILGRSKVAVANFEQTAVKEANLTLDLAHKGVGGGVPLINRWIQAKRTSIQGDPDVTAFNAALTSFKNEYARIMSSPTATGGQTTDAARNEADTLINTAMNLRGIESAIRTMKIGMENRINSINEEYAATKQRITELGSGGAKPRDGTTQQPAHAGPKEGDRTKSKSGKDIIYKDGHWQYE